jgi:hypothetical protein
VVCGLAYFCGDVSVIWFGVVIGSVAFVRRAPVSLVAEFSSAASLCTWSVLTVTPATNFHVDTSDIEFLL